MTKRTRRLLLMWVGIPGGIIGVLLASLALFILRSGDLEPVRQRARAEGIATTWAEVGRTATSGHADLLSELRTMNKELVRSPKLQDLTNHWDDPRTPVPESLSEVYFSPTWNLIPDMDAWLKRWDRVPLCVESSPRNAYDNSGVTEIRHLATWHSERILVSDPIEVADIHRALDFRDAVRVDTPGMWRSRSGIERTILGACTRHLDSLKGEQPALAMRLRQMADAIDGEYLAVMAGQVIDLNSALEEDPFDYARSMGIPLPGFLSDYPLVMRIYHRLGRAAILQNRCDELRIIRLGMPLPPAPNYSTYFRVFSDPSVVMSVCVYLGDPSYYRGDFVWLKMQRHQFYLRVFAALLDGSVLPDDPMAGTRPRAFIFNNRLEKIYGVGSNGIDDGGRGDDWWIQVYLPADHSCLLGLPPPTVENDPLPDLKEVPGRHLPPGFD